MFGRNTKNIIAKVFSMGVALLATLMITRIVVSKSGEELYGFYSMTADFVNYAAVLSVALNSMAGRFITVKYYDGDIESVNRLFNTILYANVILAAFFLLPMIGVLIYIDKLITIDTSYVNEVRTLFLLMFLNYIITILSSVFSVSTFMKNRVDLDSIRQGESYLIKLIIIYGLYFFFAPNVVYIGIGTIIATVYIWIVNIQYVKKLTPEITMFQHSSIAWGDLRELLSSGIWNSISRVGAILLNGLDLIIANQFIGSTALGILSIAKTLPKYFFAAIGGFASVFTPGITIDYAKGDKDTLINRTVYSIKICTLASNIISALLVVLGTRIYEIWIPGQQIVSIQYITIIAIAGMIVVMPMEPLWALFTATNKVKTTSIYLLIESVLTILTVFGLLAIPSSELVKLMIIAGVSSFYEIIRGIFFMPIFAAKVLDIRWSTFYPPLIRAIIAFMISLVIGINISNAVAQSGWMMLILLLILLGVIDLLIDIIVVFTKPERKLAVQMIRDWRNKK